MGSWVDHFVGMLPLLSVAVVVVLGIAALVCRLLPAGRRPTRETALWGGLFLVWLLATAALTLTPGAVNPWDPPGPRVDLIPFRTLLREGPGLGWIALWERVANVVMFAVGAVLWSWTARQGVARTALVFLVLGVGIEVLQLPLHRAVTTDDVIWAVLGGVLGSLVGRRRPAMGWGPQA